MGFQTLKQYSTLFLTFIFCAFSIYLKAEDEKYTNRINGSDILINRSFKIKDVHYDYMQANGTWESDFFAVAENTNYVSIEIDQNYPTEVLGYNDITIVFDLEVWDKAGQLSTVNNVSLSINPNSNLGGAKKQLELYKFQNAHKFEITIVSISDLNGTIQLPGNISLELGMDIRRYYYFDNNHIISQSDHRLIDFNSNPEVIPSTNTTTSYSNANEIEIFWPNVQGAESYDLEWTHINNYDELANDFLNASEIPFSNEKFNTNATRINTKSLHYRIPLIFDKGFIAYRVRGIGRLADGQIFVSEEDLLLAVQGQWSSKNIDLITDPTISDFGANFQLVSGHQLAKNWQLTTSFAENGKKKEVISYFDGSLRSRQSVTRNNSLNKAIVGETFYDHQGRPVIQTLPVPSEKQLDFYDDFNLNPNADPYSKLDFDLDGAASQCIDGASAMNEISGAANYYSPLNPNQNDQQAYLPDANGYVFTQTEYTPDNSGRFARQSGVGESHQLGSGHETKYIYGTPSQEELNLLFGEDVGIANHYKKTVVIDPNGQASVSYSDLKGNTIATGLLGDAPASLLSIPDGVQYNPITIDMLEKASQLDVNTDTDNNYINNGENGLEMSHGFIYPQPDDFSAVYTIHPIPSYKEVNCAIDFQAVVDVKIQVLEDACQEIKFSESELIGVQGLTGATTVQQISTGVPEEYGSGSYTVDKSLTINEDALNYYADQYIQNSTCIEPFSTFLATAWLEYDTVDCFSDTTADGFFDCAGCVTALGSSTTFIANGGTQTEWDELVRQCEIPCTYISQCEILKGSMLADVSPTGQYANYQVDANGDFYSNDLLSVFNEGLNASYPNHLPDFSGAPNWRTPSLGAYKDSKGGQSTILVINGYPKNTKNAVIGTIYPQELLELKDFIHYWENTWAETLIEFHPEYKYLRAFCPPQTTDNGNSSSLKSEEYDWVLQITESFTAAQSLQYKSRPSISMDLTTYNGTSNIYSILENDPLFMYTGNSFYPLKTKMVAELSNIFGSNLNIYDFAAAQIQCGNWYGSDYANCPYSFSSLSNVQKDLAWQYIRSFYHSVKLQVIWDEVTDGAIHEGGAQNVGYFNGAIGVANFSFIDYLTSRYIGQPSSSNGIAVNTIYNGQKVSGSTANLYGGKVKRFPFYDPYLQTPQSGLGASQVEDEMYLRTGLCKETFELKGFIEFMAQNNLLKVNTNLLTVSAFSRNLYQSFSGFPDATVQPYVKYQWTPSLSNSDKTLLVDLDKLNTSTAPNVDNAIKLSFDASSVYDWSDEGVSIQISRVIQLVPTGINLSGYYGFALEVEIRDISGNFIRNEVLSGEVFGLNLSSCSSNSVAGLAHPSTFANDLQQIFNLLVSHSSGNQFVSTTADLESSPYAMAFNANINQQLDPNQTLSNNFFWLATANDKVYNIEATGSFKSLKIQFCDEPNGTNFTSSNTFSDVVFFRNISPIGPDDIPKCTSIDGQYPNFKIEAVYADYSGTTPVIESDILYGLAAFYDTDNNSNLYLSSLLNMGFHGPFTQTEEACDEFALARKQLLMLFENTKSNQNSGGSFENATQVYDAVSSTGLLDGYMLDALVGTEILYSWTVPNSAPSSGAMCYTSAEIPSDPDNYIGIFYLTHGYLVDNYLIDEQANGDHYFDPMFGGVQNNSAFGYFPCEIKMEFLRQNQGLKFRDIAKYLAIKANPSASVNGLTNRFELTVQMNNGDIELIEGESCFQIASCYSCVSQSPAIPSNCWKDVTTYNTAVAGISNAPVYTEEEFCKLPMKSHLIDYMDYLSTMNIGSAGSVYFVDFEEFGKHNMGFYLNNYYDYLITTTSATNKAQIAANLPSSNPSFISLKDFSNNQISALLVNDYEIFNQSYPGELSILDFGQNYDPEFPCPLIDFNFPEDDTIADVNPCVELYIQLVTQNAQEDYDNYLNALKKEFKRNYRQHILDNVVETFTRYSEKGFGDYHFTLYYYDQVGNLVKTIPPAGVDVAYGGSSSSKPNHTLATNYRYNALNQLVSQNSPDGGTTQFWYDKLSRLVASQNAKQALANEYSYTKYDKLGRIEEVGQLTSTTTPSSNLLNDALFPSNWNSIREQVNRNYYDEVVLDEAEDYYKPNGFEQENLRNRVSSIAYYDNINDGLSNYLDNYSHATHYSYDVHGNVKSVIQDNKGSFGDVDLLKIRFKRMDYLYELVSGNVKELQYQKGEFDQFKHRYYYDADNRIVEVQTSKNGLIWDRDAHYNYYDHGPLARTELGEFAVQGMDFAYTLQGWLKSLNSSTLMASRDMGKDSKGEHGNFSRDMYAFSLQYFQNDYEAIGEYNTTAASKMVLSEAGINAQSLFNGNISSIVNSVSDNQENTIRTQANRYRYDQLNRIREVDLFHNMDQTEDKIQLMNSLIGAHSTIEYQSRYTYDGNGNLLTLKRNGTLASTNAEMDDFQYEYYAGTNKLKRVEDRATVLGYNYPNDLESQVDSNNYTYDAIGNMIGDKSENIGNIIWRTDGKIAEIIRDGGTAPNLEFKYDAIGNRLAKIVKPQTGGQESGEDQWVISHYSRDASGNVMAIYKQEFEACVSCTGENSTHVANFKLSEQMIYGSDRVGVQYGEGQLTYELVGTGTGNNLVFESPSNFSDDENPVNFLVRTIGNKAYELKNHLGNVYSSISDSKIWKTEVEEEALIVNEFEDVGELSEWTLGEEASSEFQNGMVEISYSSSEQGWSREMSINNGCYYSLEFEIGDFSNDFKLVVKDNYGNTILQEIISEGGEHKFSLEDLDVFGSKSLTFSFQSIFGDGNFGILGFYLLSNCTEENLVVDVISSNDYYSFGSKMPGRNYQGSDNYRFGFNGMEGDDEVRGNENSYDFGARIYDPRLGKWLGKDPLMAKYPSLSPYQFAGNMPIIAIDPNGKEIVIVGSKEFIKRTKAHLAKLQATKKGAELIEFLHNKSDFVITITEINAGFETQEYVPNTGRIYIGTGELGGFKIADFTYLDEFTTLAHELDHAKRHGEVYKFRKMTDDELVKDKKNFELSAVLFTNYIRDVYKYSVKRQVYGGKGGFGYQNWKRKDYNEEHEEVEIIEMNVENGYWKRIPFQEENVPLGSEQDNTRFDMDQYMWFEETPAMTYETSSNEEPAERKTKDLNTYRSFEQKSIPKSK